MAADTHFLDQITIDGGKIWRWRFYLLGSVADLEVLPAPGEGLEYYTIGGSLTWASAANELRVNPDGENAVVFRCRTPPTGASGIVLPPRAPPGELWIPSGENDSYKPRIVSGLCNGVLYVQLAATGITAPP